MNNSDKEALQLICSSALQPEQSEYMAMIKTSEEIEALKEGGAILSGALRKVREACAAGVTTEELEDIARKEIEGAGGKPSFLGYQITKKDPKFSSALCISINDEIVHGPALPSRELKDGDVIGIDVGMWFKDLATDMATTVIIGEVSDELKKLVSVTRESLVVALKAVKAGASLGEIGAAVEDVVSPHGFGIVRDLVGHGVGHEVHEPPQIPNFRTEKAMKVVMKKGMILAIEPMVTTSGSDIKVKDDGWTIVAKDGSIAAHFEVTVAVTEDGYDLITPWPDV